MRPCQSDARPERSKGASDARENRAGAVELATLSPAVTVGTSGAQKWRSASLGGTRLAAHPLETPSVAACRRCSVEICTPCRAGQSGSGDARRVAAHPRRGCPRGGAPAMRRGQKSVNGDGRSAASHLGWHIRRKAAAADVADAARPSGRVGIIIDRSIHRAGRLPSG
jgi:hypothetical protein